MYLRGRCGCEEFFNNHVEVFLKAKTIQMLRLKSPKNRKSHENLTTTYQKEPISF